MVDFLRPHIKGKIGELKTQLSQKVFLDSKVYRIRMHHLSEVSIY